MFRQFWPAIRDASYVPCYIDCSFELIICSDCIALWEFPKYAFHTYPVLVYSILLVILVRCLFFLLYICFAPLVTDGIL
jgi:hypothetical protein